MKRILLVLLLCIGFNACNFLPDVGIKSLGFGNEVEVLQNLFFEFDEELMLDGDLNQWEATPYIEFTPKIEGKFKWVGKKELMFSPSKPMKFAQNYTGKLADNLLKHKKGKLELESNEKIEFHTPYLNVKESQLFFAKNKENQQEVRLLMQLNGKYDAHNIQDEIIIKEDDKILNYKVLPSETANNLILAIENTPGLDPENIKATIKAKEGNPNKFKKDAELSFEYTAKDKLEILKVESSFKKLKGYIKVKTSQQIDLQALEKALKIVPETKYSLEISDNGFLIKGEFNQDDLYKISIDKSVSGVLGGKFDENYSTDVYFGKVNPYMEFTSKKAQYISNLGNKNIGINIVNIPKVEIKISKVYENNILPFLKGNRSYSYDEEGGEYQYNDDNNLYSDIVLEKKIETESLPQKQGVSILNLPMPDQHKQKGIYFISVRSDTEYYRNIQKIISMSDIGLIAKMSFDKNDLIVFANSIMNTKAIGNLEVKLISNSNQEIAKASTDANGVAIFKNLKKEHPNYTVSMITASTPEDFNYMLFDDCQIETSKFDIAGKNFNAANLDAFIYGDRDIYRPGEIINLNTVIRDNSWKTPSELPIKVVVKQPNGKELNAVLGKTNAFGAFANTVTLDRAAITGFYNVDVFTADDILIGSKSVSVEDFMPDRIKVNVEGPASINAGESMILKLTATNLFGPPANDKKYEIDFSVKKKVFNPTGFEAFYFGIEDNTAYTNELRNGLTDAKGIGLQDYEIPADYKNKGLLEGRMLVSVFDETGRPVHRLKTFDIFTQEQFYGIKIPEYFVGTNAPFNFELASVDTKGKNNASKAKADIYLLDYQTVLEKTEQGFRYISKKKEKLMKSFSINFSNKISSQSFIPKISGEYEIRIREAGAQNYVYTNFYAYGGGGKASFEVDTDGEVQIETDKSAYKLGESAKCIFKTPFDGKLLVTVENNGILEHRYLETKNKSVEMNFKLTDAHLPNMYVTATLIRSMNQPELPLMSAHGMAAIKVDDEKRTIPIEITAVEKSRSKTKQKVRVKTQANIQLTIAVVDEGILQLKNTATPKINEFFYQKRALGVSSFDLYPLLLPEIQLNQKSSTGGDGGLGKRVNPLANGRAELVAKWSGQLVSDANGTAEFEFEIPEFLGSLRIMVVAYKDKNFSSEQKNMTVADPIGISVGMPMFLSPKDKVAVPVSFFNNTDLVQEVVISASSTGQINNGEFKERTFKINPNAEKQAEIEVSGLENIGLGKLKVMAKTTAELFSKTTEISVRPVGSLHKFGESGILAKDKEMNFTQPQNLIEGTFSSKVYVGNAPLMQFGHRLESLLEYPHSCIEQTVSKAFPQLYFDQLVTQINGDNTLSESGNSELNPQVNVKAAIQAIESRQLYNGALSYWPGQSEEYWWGTAYALHFLIEAQKSGFEVPATVQNGMINYLTSRTNEEQKTEKLFFRVNNSTKPKDVMTSEFVYSLYVLSLTDQPNAAAMNLYKTNFQSLSNPQQFQLACAYKQIGDDKTFATILPKTFVNDTHERQLYGSFSSPIRSMALVLNSLIETDPSNYHIAKLSKSLNDILSNKNNYLNTQELSFSMLAMGKLLQKASSKGKVDVMSEGKIIKTIEGKGQWIDLSKYPKGLTMKAYDDRMFFYLESEGIRKDNKYNVEDKSLKVRRTFYTRTGEQIKTNTFKVNQLIVVKLSVSTLSGLAYTANNVVMTDMLPAGFEIENPRMVEDREMTWIKNAATPTYFDIRNDRINYFIDVDNTEQNYYYLVRAITKGTFEQGQVSADAMYNGNLRSYWGGGKVIIN
jgi:alpha-2-macroglobulin